MTAKTVLTVLRDEPDWIAIDKPAGLATIPGRGDPDCVLNRLARQIGLPSEGESDPRLRVVHRLDAETSGVLLFAKNRPTQRHFSEQFRERMVRKEYLALVVGRPAEDRGAIDAALQAHPSGKRMVVVSHGGRPARTEWEVVETFRQYTLLRVFPRTGRTHQIRVHLRHIGLPLAIDPIYNPPRPGAQRGIRLSSFKRTYRADADGEERPLMDRLTLHARRISFIDRLGIETEIESPPPKDFRALLNMLRKYGR